MSHPLEQHWYRLTAVSVLLAPLGLLFRAAVALRRALYRTGLLPSTRLPVPVIVVGNITVGGTGKTPLVIWLAGQLRAAGYRPGIITRGYRGRSHRWPLSVSAETSPAEAGDEAVLLAQRAGCPVIAGPDRVADARQLLEQGCDVIVSDDGLQHYRLQRDLEIAVLDGERRLGNGLCLPAGPLREPPSRLTSVAWRVANGAARAGELGMRLEPDRFYNLLEPRQTADAGAFQAGAIHALAGIGHPQRFFATLRQRGIDVIPHPFPDHHAFRAEDLDFGDVRPVILTEKDAVKCRPFARPHHWVLAVNAHPDERLAIELRQRLEEMRRGQETS